MIQKPIVALGICTGIFTYCTVVNVASIMQAVGAISAGTTAMIILYFTIRDKWRGRSK